LRVKSCVPVVDQTMDSYSGDRDSHREERRRDERRVDRRDERRDERRDGRISRRDPTSVNQICNDFIKGKCFRSTCKFLHPSANLNTSLDSYIPNYSAPLQSDSGRSLDSYIPRESRKSTHRSTDIFIEYCRDFLKGRCKSGTDCGYAHVLNAASPHVLPSSSRMSIVRCADFNRSYCNREVCKFAHIENWESVLGVAKKAANFLIKEEKNENQNDIQNHNDHDHEHEHEDKKRKYDEFQLDGLLDSTSSPNKKHHSIAIRALFSLVQDWDEDRLYELVSAIENQDVYDFGAERTNL